MDPKIAFHKKLIEKLRGPEYIHIVRLTNMKYHPPNLSLILLFLITLFPAVYAQRVTSGGKPKKASVEGYDEAFCVNLSGHFRVCRALRRESGETRFLIEKGGKTLSVVEAPYPAACCALEDFWAYRGDLDKDGSPEVIIAALIGISNGMGISTFEINIFRDPVRSGGQKPLSFTLEEWGENGNLIFDTKRNETLVLVTHWQWFDNLDLKRGEGMYLTGKWFRYKDGLLAPAYEKPTLARRLLNSFADERNRTGTDPRTPYLWLKSKNSHRFFSQPKERAKLIAVRSGIITDLKSYEYGSRGFTIQLDSGTLIETQMGYNHRSGKDGDRYNVTDFGLSKQRFVFPFDLGPEVVVKSIVGRKVRLETYLDQYDYQYSQIWLLDN